MATDFYRPSWLDLARTRGERELAYIRDQENRIRVAIDDLVEFLNVMGAD